MLAVQGLSKSFAGVHAVREVSFGLEAGHMLALIGPNGAGKSTCFQCINGQLRPDAGTVRLDGADVSGLAVADRARLGMGRTFQIAQVAASLTVRQHVGVALAARRRGGWLRPRPRGLPAPAAEIDPWLDRFGLAARGDAVCGELPYPELKRVELACVLAQRPRVLLMDEPTAGMTRDDRHALMRVVREEARRGLAVLFTEHSMDVVFGFADRVLVMVRGAVVADGPPAEIERDPAVRAAYLGSAHGTGGLA
ncbi:ABC transporter ATP-binding protein [Pigmentiphaga soli]|uniref:ABC transporter ATP-binding protein n=2 Tax=Pigmentiphaga soli TaxID=1007095 RepID=A0ABP8GX82_9BURK